MVMLSEIHVKVSAPQDSDADDEPIDAYETDLTRHLEAAALAWLADKGLPLRVAVTK